MLFRCWLFPDKNLVLPKLGPKLQFLDVLQQTEHGGKGSQPFLREQFRDALNQISVTENFVFAGSH